MNYFCCQDRRRHDAVAAQGTIDGIDFLEVIDGPLVPESQRQRYFAGSAFHQPACREFAWCGKRAHRGGRTHHQRKSDRGVDRLGHSGEYFECSGASQGFFRLHASRRRRRAPGSTSRLRASIRCFRQLISLSRWLVRATSIVVLRMSAQPPRLPRRK